MSFDLNLATFAHIFGLPYDVDLHCPDVDLHCPDEFSCTSTWQSISTFAVSDWNHVPDFHIHHPVLRVDFHIHHPYKICLISVKKEEEY